MSRSMASYTQWFRRWDTPFTGDGLSRILFPGLPGCSWIQIQDVADGNRQPFLMATESGLNWFVSTEPYGESHGIFKIFLVDAVTGRIKVYELPESQTLTGPVRATDYVRRSNPIVDWSRFRLVEPLPFVRQKLKELTDLLDQFETTGGESN